MANSRPSGYGGASITGCRPQCTIRAVHPTGGLDSLATGQGRCRKDLVSLIFGDCGVDLRPGFASATRAALSPGICHLVYLFGRQARNAADQRQDALSVRAEHRGHD